jgi:predicted alpha/beta-fold hydrolase
LGRYLGEFKDQNIFKGAVLVSNPWDMLRASRFLEGAYDGYIV